MKRKKRSLKLVDQVSVLAESGTLDFIRAVAYFRGKRGKLGEGFREIYFRGRESFLASLTEAERGRFNQIVRSVKETRLLQKAVEDGG